MQETIAETSRATRTARISRNHHCSRHSPCSAENVRCQVLYNEVKIQQNPTYSLAATIRDKPPKCFGPTRLSLSIGHCIITGADFSTSYLYPSPCGSMRRSRGRRCPGCTCRPTTGPRCPARTPPHRPSSPSRCPPSSPSRGGG